MPYNNFNVTMFVMFIQDYSVP